MTQETKLILTDQDFERLSALLLQTDEPSSELLEEEISRATITPVEKAPTDIVRMNSIVRFVDEETLYEAELSLVYPNEADIEKMKVSILAPVGTALLGLRAGQTISWEMPTGKIRRLKVLSILPPADGKAP